MRNYLPFIVGAAIGTIQGLYNTHKITTYYKRLDAEREIRMVKLKGAKR